MHLCADICLWSITYPVYKNETQGTEQVIEKQPIDSDPILTEISTNYDVIAYTPKNRDIQSLGEWKQDYLQFCRARGIDVDLKGGKESSIMGGNSLRNNLENLENSLVKEATPLGIFWNDAYTAHVCPLPKFR
jgi:hypothetical protein